MSNMIWNLGTTAAAILGATAARKVSELVWKKATSDQAPDAPSDPEVHWGLNLVFAALSGTLVQLIRMAIDRQSTRTYIKATGRHPRADKA